MSDLDRFASDTAQRVYDDWLLEKAPQAASVVELLKRALYLGLEKGREVGAREKYVEMTTKRTPEGE